jgi:hypothetical protein
LRQLAREIHDFNGRYRRKSKKIRKVTVKSSGIGEMEKLDKIMGKESVGNNIDIGEF